MAEPSRRRILGVGDENGLVPAALSVHAAMGDLAELLTARTSGPGGRDRAERPAPPGVRVSRLPPERSAAQGLITLQQGLRAQRKDAHLLEDVALLHLDASEPEAVLILAPEAQGRGIPNYLNIGQFGNYFFDGLGTREAPFTPLDLLHAVDYIQLPRDTAVAALQEAESRQPDGGIDPAKVAGLSPKDLAHRLLWRLELATTYRDASMMLRPERTLLVTEQDYGTGYAVLRPKAKKGKFTSEGGFVPAFTGPIPGYPDDISDNSRFDGVYAGAVATSVLRRQPLAVGLRVASIVAASEARGPGSPLNYTQAKSLMAEGSAPAAAPGAPRGGRATPAPGAMRVVASRARRGNSTRRT